MTNLCLLFIPPVHSIIRKKWSRLILNSALYGTVCLFTALITGCTSQTDQAEQSFRQTVSTESSGYMAVISFKKTDGQAMDVEGIKTYNLMYEARIQMQHSGVWLRGANEMSFRFSTDQPAAGTWNAFGTAVMENGLAVRVDQIIKVTGTLTGEKSENGWKFHITEQNYIKDPFLAP